jgi:hypothetical protein
MAIAPIEDLLMYPDYAKPISVPWESGHPPMIPATGQSGGSCFDCCV